MTNRYRLIERAETTPHRTDIPSQRAGADNARLTELLTKVFQLHTLTDAIFIAADPHIQPPTHERPLPTAQHITAEFYGHNYINMHLNVCLSGGLMMPVAD